MLFQEKDLSFLKPVEGETNIAKFQGEALQAAQETHKPNTAILCIANCLALSGSLSLCRFFKK